MAEEDLSSATSITMMQSADFRNSYDSSQSLPLNRPRFRRILCQRQMSPGIQIVTEVSFENPSQIASPSTMTCRGRSVSRRAASAAQRVRSNRLRFILPGIFLIEILSFRDADLPTM
jgi:hypothetical protein